ncbi:MAG: anti-sigma factor [Gloeomargarita sp. DG_2_bins_126]
MNDPTQELLAGLVLGDVSEPEAQEWEARIASNPALAQELGELQTVWHSLAYACEAVAPPPDLKRRILATAPARPRWWLWGIAGAGILGSCALGALSWHTHRELRLTQQELQVQREVVAALQNRDTQMVTLTGTNTAQGAMARVITAQGEVLVVFNQKLPPPPKNQVYVLWAITQDGQKMACGKFIPNAQGVIRWAKPRFMPNHPSVKTLAITQEPEMTDQPTGPLVMDGSAI